MITAHDQEKEIRTGCDLLSLRGVTFRYPQTDGFSGGVADLDLTVTAGRIVGLLGPNGAGKTTTIKLMAGLLLAQRGTVDIEGSPARPQHHLRPLRVHIGLALCGERGLYPRLSAMDNLRLFAALQNLPRRTARTRIAEVLAQVELTEVASRHVNQLSRGMRQRLHIARALLHEPRILLVDEPTLGVDPEAARGVRLLLKSVAATGSAVVVATNYLPEAADLCESLAVLHQGRLVFDGPPSQLMLACQGRVVSEVLLRTTLTKHEVEGRLAAYGKVAAVRRGEFCLVELLSVGSAPSGASIVELLGEGTVAWQTQRPPNLEDAYTCLTRAAQATAEGR